MSSSRRWRTSAAAVPVALALVLSACAADPVAGPSDAISTDATPRGTGSTVPSSDPGTTVGTSWPGTTSTTIPGDPSEVEPYQAEVTSSTCHLRVLPAGFGNVPPPPSTVPTPRVQVPEVVPPDAAVPVVLPGPASPLSRVGDWFQAGEHGLAHLDPRSAAVDVALTTDGCSIAFAATNDSIAAALACELDGPTPDDRQGCAVLATSIPDGTEVGRWAVDDPELITDLAIDATAIVVASRGTVASLNWPEAIEWTALPRALRFDVASGKGTALMATCDGSPRSITGVIERTSLAMATCGTSPRRAKDVIDLRDGTVLAQQPYHGDPRTITSDGNVATTVDGSRYDATSFALLAPSPVPPSLLEVPYSDVRLPNAIVLPGAVWLWRTTAKEDPTGHVSDTLTSLGLVTGEIVLLDDRGDVLERWPATTIYSSNKSGFVVHNPLVAADETGAWLSMADTVYRIDRSTGAAPAP